MIRIRAIRIRMIRMRMILMQPIPIARGIPRPPSPPTASPPAVSGRIEVATPPTRLARTSIWQVSTVISTVMRTVMRTVKRTSISTVMTTSSSTRTRGTGTTPITFPVARAAIGAFKPNEWLASRPLSRVD
ncbi:MAG: hypothetical protein RLY70_4898 [Planctomycetota bacterium]